MDDTSPAERPPVLMSVEDNRSGRCLAHDPHLGENSEVLQIMMNSSQDSSNSSSKLDLGWERDESCYCQDPSPQLALAEIGNFQADTNASFTCNVMSLLNCAAQESRNDLEHLRDALHHTIRKTYSEGMLSFGRKRRRSNDIKERGYEAYYAARWRGHLPLSPMVTMVLDSGEANLLPRGNDDAVRVGAELVGF